MTALCRVKPQPDRRGRGRRDHHTLDLRRQEGALDKPPTQPVVRLGEQPGALNPNDAVFGKQDLYVDTADSVGAGNLVIHDLVPCARFPPRCNAATTARSGALSEAVDQPSSSSMAARPPSRNPCITGFSCGNDWGTSTAAETTPYASAYHPL